MAGIFKAYDIRGTYPDQVNELIAFRVGYHFREILDDEDLALGPKVVVSRDMRSHSEPLASALKAGLRAAGVEVIDIGLCDTPCNYFAIGELGASGGIQVTASHNPPQYNGFKMSRREAIPVSRDTGIAHLERLVTESKVSSDTHSPKAGESHVSVWDKYEAHVLSHLTVSEPKLKLAADAANGMGTLYLGMLERLNVELIPLYFELDGTFPNHEANPLKPENLEDLKKTVLEQRCDLGVAFDGDADRAIFVDDKGETVTADFVTALLAPVFLEKEPGAAIVYDLRSSWVTREAIEAAGGKPVRERVGHSFIKATMRKLNSPFGGELAGHFYYRSNYTADSSIITLVLLLNLMRSKGKSLSQLVAPLKKYHATGEINFQVEDKEEMIKRLAQIFSDGKVDFLDGITVQYSDWWFNVRPSNTEPLLRLVLEARTKELMEEKKRLLLDILGEPV